MKPEKHSRVSTPMAASIGAAVLVCLLLFSFVMSSDLLHEQDGLTLPSNDQTEPIDSAGGQVLTAQSVADVEITVQNAQQIIASLMRPRHYSMQVENTLYYTGGSSALYVHCYVRENAMRIDSLSQSGAVQQSILRTGDEVYAWSATESTPYHGAWGTFSGDAAAMLPSYEDVLEEGVVLSEASRVDLAGEPCIRVVFDQNGYRCEYAVSAVNGLLRTASFFDEQTLTRQVAVSELLTDLPDESYFKLPNGRSVLGESQ